MPNYANVYIGSAREEEFWGAVVSRLLGGYASRSGLTDEIVEEVLNRADQLLLELQMRKRSSPIADQISGM